MIRRPGPTPSPIPVSLLALSILTCCGDTPVHEYSGGRKADSKRPVEQPATPPPVIKTTEPEGAPPEDKGPPLDPLFKYTKTEALATVELRDDHTTRACRSPQAFLGAVKATLVKTNPSAGLCSASVVSPMAESGVTLMYHCPLKIITKYCVELFEGIVWLELVREKGPKPYVATYSLVGISKGYIKCRPHSDKVPYANEEAVRRLDGSSQPGMLGGSVFEHHAKECE